MSRKRAAILVGIALTMLAGHRPQASTQATPSTGLLLIVSMDEAKVDIVDEGTSRTVASLNTGKTPHEVRIGPDGRTAYVVAGRIITAIDLSSMSVKRTFDLGEFAAHDVRISRDGRRFWAACARSQTVLEVDTENGAVLKRLPTGRDGAWFVEVNRDESKLYTPNLEGKSISVITRDTGEVKVLPLESEGYGIDITPDGKHVVVSGRGITVVDTRTDVIARTIATAAPETGRIRLTPDGRRLVVAMAKTVEVYELATGRLVQATALPAAPKVMVLSADGRRAYLTNPEDHSATVVDLEAGRVVTTLTTGKRPDGIAWAPKAAGLESRR